MWTLVVVSIVGVSAGGISYIMQVDEADFVLPKKPTTRLLLVHYRGIIVFCVCTHPIPNVNSCFFSFLFKSEKGVEEQGVNNSYSRSIFVAFVFHLLQPDVLAGCPSINVEVFLCVFNSELRDSYMALFSFFSVSFLELKSLWFRRVQQNKQLFL